MDFVAKGEKNVRTGKGSGVYKKDPQMHKTLHSLSGELGLMYGVI